jgi:HK97 family phage major capsid protein
MATLTTENVLAAMRDKEAEAASKHASAVKLRDDMIAAGVNPLTDKDNFDKLDVAFKSADMASQEVEELRDRLATMKGWDGAVSPNAGNTTPRGNPGNQPGPRTRLRIGARLTEAPAYKAARARLDGIGEAQFAAAMNEFLKDPLAILSRDEFASILEQTNPMATAVTGSSSTSAGPFIQNDLQPGFIAYRRKRPTIAGVVFNGETDSDVVEYVSQSAPTNSAAPTAETNSSQESAYPFATNTTNVQEIVHHVPITRRAMSDAGQMRTIIEGDLVTDVLDKLDDQLATGAGTGDELEGIYTAVTQAQALGSDTRADCLHKAMTKIRVAAGVYGEPDYIGIHPNDYQDCVLETDASGRYLLGDPGLAGPRTVWGVPFLISTVFTDGTPLVGNYYDGARMWLREGVTLLSGLNSDDFVKRRISLMATMRLAFKTVRPTAFCEATGF